MLTEFFLTLNNSKIMWGVTMILLNMGSRFIIADLGKAHEKLLQTEFVKKIILFSMFFVATRDIITAFILTVVYVIVVDGIFHEKSTYAVVKVDSPKASDAAQTEQDAYQTYINNVNLLRLQ